MSEAAAEDQVSEDDWAAAMAEQTTAEEALAALDSGATPAAQPANIFPQFGESAHKPDEGLRDFEMILDIPVQLTVELGRTKISIRNLLQLGHGSVVELDQPAAAGPWLGSGAGRHGRRADGRAGKRHPDRTGRSGGGERQVRHPPDRHHHPGRAHEEAQALTNTSS